MNKTTLIASTLLALSLAAASQTGAHAQPAGGGDLVLQVHDVRAGEGPLMVALFDSETSWRGGEEGAVRLARDDADAATVAVRFDDLPSGTYAIRLFQDLDANGDLNTGFLGIPTEPYAFSNDAPVRFGPPGWADVRFTVTATGARQSVSLSP